MYVKDKEMYHFHTPNEYDNLWYVGNEIIVDDSFNSMFYEIGMSQTFTIKGNDDTLYQVDYYLNEFLKEIDNKSKEDIIELLKKATNITHDIALRDRELLMEECRRLYYPDKVSRNHAMYLCDEKSLDFWQSQLSKDTSLFKLSVIGELFQSHNDLVPNRAFSGELMIEEAKKYWEANLENCDKCKSEYLFQGHAKILKKIK